MSGSPLSRGLHCFTRSRGTPSCRRFVNSNILNRALFGYYELEGCATIPRRVSLAVCGIVATLACAGQILAQATPSPPPTSAIAVLTDPCGGYQELLKKYLSASPCVFVRGQASIQATYSGTNVPVAFTQTLG